MPAAHTTLSLNRSLIPMGSRICAAVSGGADSTALLLALYHQRNELGIGVSAVHLHHGIRTTEADHDRDFLIDLCQRLDIPLLVEHADIPAEAAKLGEGVEVASRRARICLFERLLEQGSADLVATAHTLDDQAETVMMKLLRGAWTEGLAGIYPRVQKPAGAIVRPLLHLTRVEIEAYLQVLGQSWCTDSTNLSDAYTRNRIRHTLVPLLKEFNPQIANTLAATAELAREEEDRWSRDLERLLPQLLLPGKPVRGGGRAVSTSQEVPSYAMEVERLRTLDLPTRRRVLRAAAQRMGCRLSAAETLRLLRLCGLQPEMAPSDPTVTGKIGSKLTLPNGLRAERSARELRLSRS